MNAPRIIIFGTGNGGSNAARFLSKSANIIAFLDNNPARHGRRFKGKPVCAPSALNNMGWDEIHIASTSYYRAMADQLLSLGVPAEKIRAVASDVLQAERSGCSLFCAVYYSAWVMVMGAGVGGVVWLLR